MLETVQRISPSYVADSRTDGAARTPVVRAPDAVISAEQLPVSSPRLNIDPVVGVIVQFLSSSGSVESQSPSFAAEAYLRAGLTPEGFSKDTAEDHTKLTV